MSVSTLKQLFAVTFRKCLLVIENRLGRMFILATVGTWLLLPGSTLASDKIYQESQVHAVFLYNITKFINWPDSAFDDAQSPIQICTLGKTPVADYLSKIIDGDRVKGRLLASKKIESVAASHGCHILFLTPISARLHADNLANLRESSMLLVSTTDNFVENGGMLTLRQTGKRIKPVINLQAVRKANINISSKLLRLSTIVNMEEK